MLVNVGVGHVKLDMMYYLIADMRDNKAPMSLLFILKQLHSVAVINKLLIKFCPVLYPHARVEVERLTTLDYHIEYICNNSPIQFVDSCSWKKVQCMFKDKNLTFTF